MPSPTRSNPSSPEKDSPSRPRCTKCQNKPASPACSLCMNCCDSDDCEKHARLRAQAIFREQVFEGTTEAQQQAAAIRKRRVPPGLFADEAIQYMGDTIMIWNFRQFATNKLWYKEAIRKSRKRKALQPSP